MQNKNSEKCKGNLRILQSIRVSKKLASPSDKVHHIKNLRNEKSLSINEISRRTGFYWETGKKYADEDQIPEESLPRKGGDDVCGNMGRDCFRLADGRLCAEEKVAA
ncbi:hypothetical protein BLX87_05345 [Bacillus sp. VT-16-64]|nr:hypothetical protein BLX87_05345 [Bacillus sp. VT-16-64]